MSLYSDLQMMRSSRQKLIRCIPRNGFTTTKVAIVCIKHFSAEFIVTKDCVKRTDGSILCVQRSSPKLAEEVYPSIFLILPSYLSSESQKKRRTPAERCRTGYTGSAGI
jgi:hypothetical protein